MFIILLVQPPPFSVFCSKYQQKHQFPQMYLNKYLGNCVFHSQLVSFFFCPNAELNPSSTGVSVKKNLYVFYRHSRLAFSGESHAHCVYCRSENGKYLYLCIQLCIAIQYWKTDFQRFVPVHPNPTFAYGSGHYLPSIFITIYCQNKTILNVCIVFSLNRLCFFFGFVFYSSKKEKILITSRRHT